MYQFNCSFRYDWLIQPIEPGDDADQQHVNEGLHAPRPAPRLALTLGALIDEVPVD